MTKLECTVMNCFYNENKYCGKGDIMVDGQDARTSGSTCCASFKERKDAPSNAVCRPKKEIQVECRVCSCIHNKDKKCAAEQIGISGNNACDCKETECVTFVCK